MADLELKGTLDFSGMVSLTASGGKVKAGGLEVLVEQASGTAAAPVLLPPPPASPATTSVAVKVIVSLNKTVTAGGQAIVTQGMCLQGDLWPGFVLRGSGTVTINHIPMNVQNEQATIFPSGAPATFSSSGQ